MKSYSSSPMAVITGVSTGLDVPPVSRPLPP